jgi:hypothetical protein
MIVFNLNWTQNDMDGDWAREYYTTLAEAKARSERLSSDESRYGLFGHIDRIEVRNAPKAQLVLNLLNNEHWIAKRERKLDFEIAHPLRTEWDDEEEENTNELETRS